MTGKDRRSGIDPAIRVAPFFRLKLLGAFAAVYLIWGSTYLAIRFAVETIPPFLSIGLRFIAGGTAVYSWKLLRGAVRPTRDQWIAASVNGALLLLGGTGLVAWAEQTVPSGLAALMVATMPLWLAGMDRMVYGTRISPATFAGIVMGFIGVVILVGPEQLAGGGRADPVASGVIVIASVLWAAGSLYSRAERQHPDPMVASGMSMLAGGFILVVAGTLLGELSGFDPAAVTTRSWLALIYLATFGTAAFSAFIWLMRATTAARASSYSYVNPVVAVILGWALGGEEITGRTVLAMAVIVSAVWVIVTGKTKRRDTGEHPRTRSTA